MHQHTGPRLTASPVTLTLGLLTALWLFLASGCETTVGGGYNATTNPNQLNQAVIELSLSSVLSRAVAVGLPFGFLRIAPVDVSALPTRHLGMSASVISLRFPDARNVTI